MKIFISWSGERSKRTALLLEKWIQGVIHAAEPWVSTNIESGASWSVEVDKQLATTFGIICLTKDNYEKPWILFEAGALALGLDKSRVCTLLIDSIELKEPLARFQQTTPNKEGMLKLINTINNHVEKPVPNEILKNGFELYWPQFEDEFIKISKSTSDRQKLKREMSEVLEDLLTTVRSFDNRLYGFDNRLYQLELLKNARIEDSIIYDYITESKKKYFKEETLSHLQARFPNYSLDRLHEMYNKVSFKLQAMGPEEPKHNDREE